MALGLDNFVINLATAAEPIENLPTETGLPTHELSVYKRYFGLKTILIERQRNQSQLLQATLEAIFNLIKHNYGLQLKYLIYIHTNELIALNGQKFFANLINNLIWHPQYAFTSTQYKCAGLLKWLELLQHCLKLNESALLITGEIAFSKTLRLIPGSTIIGDASTALIIGHSKATHRLLNVYSKFIPGYAAGIYASNNLKQQFDAIFISQLAEFLQASLDLTNLTWQQIKLILPYNNNVLTWVKLAQALTISVEKFYLHNIARYGHCYASDTLINLKTALDETLLQPGDYYLCIACGLGFYMTCAILQF